MIQERKKLVGYAGVLAFLAGGFVFFIVAVWSSSNAHYIATSTSSVGTVVKTHNPSRRSGGYHYATIEYTDQSGVVRQHRPRVGFSADMVRAGSEVSIFYKPGDPASVRAGGLFMWAFPVLLGGSGLIAAIAGWIVWRRPEKFTKYL